MGLQSRKNKNEALRANGEEPFLGKDASLKRRMRYLARVGHKPITIKRPEKYLHSSRTR